MLQLCVLEADILREELAPEYSGYGVMFKQLFDKQPLPISLDVFNVINGAYPDPRKRYDGYLITGSKYDSFSTENWVLVLKEFVSNLYHDGHKIIGVCFGHQLLSLVLGGEVWRAPRGWGMGVHRYEVSAHKDWMIPPQTSFKLQVSHQDQVLALPAEAELIASSEFCPVAAYVVDDQILCFQGHPEFTENYTRELLSLRKGILDPDVFDKALTSLDEQDHGVVIAQWITQFLISHDHRPADAFQERSDTKSALGIDRG
ncbi:amidotransferase [Pseudomonas putida]|uniref:amidotransferase n=1 Tax=Pseudomonas putida TaxID=303 RepID=UPI003570ADDA